MMVHGQDTLTAARIFLTPTAPIMNSPKTLQEPADAGRAIRVLSHLGLNATPNALLFGKKT